MARCYACKTEIRYSAMFGGVFKYFKRNIIRKNLPIFPCPHCGIECQETAWSYYGYIGIFVCALFFTLMQFHGVRAAFLDNAYSVFVCLGIFIIGNYMWWQKLAKLKEPYLFWGKW